MVNRSPAQLLSLVPGLAERAKVSRPSCPLISTHLFLHFRSVSYCYVVLAFLDHVIHSLVVRRHAHESSNPE